MDDFSFFDCSNSFCFMLTEFHCAFSISYRIPQYYVYYYSIWLGNDRPSGLFFCTRFTSFNTHAFLLTFICFFVLFHCCCSHARVFGKTLLREFPFAVPMQECLGKHSCVSSLLLFPSKSVWENTRAWVPFSYIHTERYVIFSRGEIVLCFGQSFTYQNLIILLLLIFMI